MHGLPTIDVIVLVAYVAGVVALGCWFVRTSGTPEQFMAAGRSLPGWAVGLSIFGTFLSSNTFLGVPGAAFGGNWNRFVFSLSLPVAAVIAVKVFVPFYRRGGSISAYEHLEQRFGPWARTYAVVCYLLTQLARMGSIMFGVALAMRALLGWDMATIIIATGVIVTGYTLLGGIGAVIWTDVAQSIVLSVGAIAAVVLILFDMPRGPGQLFAIAAEHGKFSLGSFGPSLAQSTFWVVLMYGLFINLNNFGIDQSYVQRYQAARSQRDATRSVWLGALAYVPVSAVFFFIGTGLFAYYQAEPVLLEQVRHDAAVARLAQEGVGPQSVGFDVLLAQTQQALTPADVGDSVFPHFIVNHLPPGCAGLLIAALFAAAMSSVDTSLNSSATVILTDLYKRYLHPDADDRRSMRVLRQATLATGAAGTAVALAMIGVQSVLDAWWRLSGVFAGGLLGLFLLGLIARRVGSAAAAIAVSVGVVVILWMTFSQSWAGLPQSLRSPFHSSMVTVIGTLTIFAVGVLVSSLIDNRRA